jgi:Uma2 family endonuclease
VEQNRGIMETLTNKGIKQTPLPRVMTEAEFLDICDEDLRAEFVDGRIIVHSPASLDHVDLSTFIVTLVKMFVDKHSLGRVLGDNFQTRLRPGLRRVPDLIFVAHDNKALITKTEIDGAPDLVVEIVSPDSVERDWRDKYFEYEKAKIREYWVIDPGSKRLQMYVLNEKNKFVAPPAEKGVVKSSVLRGFWLKSEWLWREPLPNVLKVAKELKII